MESTIKWIIIEGIETLPPYNERVLIMLEEGILSVEQRRRGESFIYSDSTDSGSAIAWAELPDTTELYDLCNKLY